MSVSCEKMVRHVVPWIRREIASALVNDYNLPQVKVAKILEVTEPAISQYLSKKRGSDIQITDDVVIAAIHDSAALLANTKKHDVGKEICNLCKLIRKRNAIPESVAKRAKINEFESCICDTD